MSVTIVPTQQPATFWQRLTGTEPKTIVRETSTTEISSHPGGGFDLKTALRNGGIGAAVAGALGGVSLLGKVALPIIGKVGSLAGLARLAGVGGAIGVATAALPLVADAARRSPATKAALTGAAIGAAAGAVLPLMPIPLGAAIGAGVGLLVHHRRNRPAPDYPVYPGYQAHPGFVPYRTGPGAPVPNGLVPVSPNYGMYAGTAMNPYGNLAGYGAVNMGYGAMPAPSYGYGTLPMQAHGAAVGQPGMQQGAVAQPVATAQPAGAAPAPGAAKAPKFRSAKTFTDKAGNLRQVGTGTVIKPAQAAIGTVRPGTAAPVGMPGASSQPSMDQLTNATSYLPGMAGALPMSGMSPLTMGAGTQAAMGYAAAAAMPAAVAPLAIPARPTA